MKSEERAAIKQSIEERIRQLSEDIETLREHMKPITLKCVVDKANKMDTISSNAVKDTVYRKSIEKLNILKMLAAKADDADFGLCRRCKKPINPQRLKLLPESTLCVYCANK